MKIIGGVLAILAIITTFLLIVFILILSMSYLRETMKEAGLLCLIFLNILNITMGISGLLGMVLLPLFVGRAVIDAIL